jgi:hypothetical protein
MKLERPDVDEEGIKFLHNGHVTWRSWEATDVSILGMPEENSS